jgi:hypothetical protein
MFLLLYRLFVFPMCVWTGMRAPCLEGRCTRTRAVQQYASPQKRERRCGTTCFFVFVHGPFWFKIHGKKMRHRWMAHTEPSERSCSQTDVSFSIVIICLRLIVNKLKNNYRFDKRNR